MGVADVGACCDDDDADVSGFVSSTTIGVICGIDGASSAYANGAIVSSTVEVRSDTRRLDVREIDADDDRFLFLGKACASLRFMVANCFPP